MIFADEIVEEVLKAMSKFPKLADILEELSVDDYDKLENVLYDTVEEYLKGRK